MSQDYGNTGVLDSHTRLMIVLSADLMIGNLFAERINIMTITKLIGNIDPEEPILIEWALRRFLDCKKIGDEETARMIEERVFNEENIARMLEHSDLSVIDKTLMFRDIPVRRFTKALPLMIEKWAEEKTLLYSEDESAKVIAQLDPQAAAALFRQFCNKTYDEQDWGKWEGIAKSLPYLSDEDAEDIAQMITEASLRGESVGNVFDILELIWKYRHPEFHRLFEEHLLEISEKYGRYRDTITGLFRIMGFPREEYELLADIIDGYTELSLPAIKTFYKDTIPPAELKDAIAKIRKGDSKLLPFSADYKEFITAFFDKHKEMIRNEQAKNTLHQLAADKKLLEKLHRKKQQPYLYAIFLAAVMASLRKESLDLSGCSVQEAVDLLTTDIEILPHPDAFAAFFKEQDKTLVIRHLTDAMKKADDRLGGAHILRVMGELGYDEFLKPMTDAISDTDNYEFIYEAGEEMLPKYKDRAIDYFIGNYDALSKNALISAVSVTEKVGGPKAFEFIDRYFDSLWKIDKEMLLGACEAICSETWLERLSPKLNKGQELIDDTYLIISLLNRGKTPETDHLLREYYRRRKEQNKKIGQKFKESADSAPPYLNAELRCRSCGDESMYRLHRVIMSDTGKPYVAQEIRCINCNEISEFELTDKGHIVVSAELMRLVSMSDKSAEEKEEAIEQSPLQIGKIMAKGKATDIGSAIDMYRKSIEKDPTDPRNYLGLGNIYFHAAQYTKSKACFEKLVGIAPHYIQAYYTLAEIAEKKESPEKASDIMESGKPYLTSFGFWDNSGLRAEEFVEAYCDYYNALIEKTKSKKPLLFPPSSYQSPVRKQKIGRNDPCPCGSGKKYKKCCLMKKQKNP